MNLSELLKKGQVRKVEPSGERAKELLAAAERDIKAAKDNLEGENYDWALAIAYSAMLSAGRALMAAQGYDATSDSHHVGVVRFCGAVLPSDSSGPVDAFNRYRMRRHDVVYGEAGSVGKDEATRAIGNAERFMARIKEKLARK